MSNAVSLRPLVGLRIIQPVALLLAFLAAFRLLRLGFAPRSAAAVLLVGTLLLYGLLVLAAIPST